MTRATEVSHRPPRSRSLWFLVGLGVVGAGGTVLRLATAGWVVDGWLVVGSLLALSGLAAWYWVTVRVSADAYGLRHRTPLRRRSVPWSAVADIRVLHREHRHGTSRRVSVALRDGRRWLLPMPLTASAHDPEFDERVAALRALLRQYGTPESDHLPVLTRRTAGYGGLAAPLALCVLLLAGAGVAAWSLPGTAADERAWRSAAPCTGEAARDTVRGSGRTADPECVTTLPGVIARIDVNGTRQSSHLYFTRERPLARADVSREAAQRFSTGDHVELAFWRGTVMQVTGEHHVWRAHVSTARAQAVVAAALALAAGCPGAGATSSPPPRSPRPW
ncbi:PH domain-containing protein [Streptomyces flavofungini]|uniref:PH domain-containing protein n=1 Tax=Streptomyces flavofungini TaxID=68200 RepID=UPI0034DDFB21